MERLFEHFVAESLRRATALPQINDLKSEAQVRTRYAQAIPPGTKEFFSKPDNVLLDASGRAVCVVDAKYKRLSDATGQRDRKPQNQDVYELVAAMTAQQCRVGLLLYPQICGEADLDDRALQRWQVDAFGQSLTIGAIGLDLMQLGDAGGAVKIERGISTQLHVLLDRAELSA